MFRDDINRKINGVIKVDQSGSDVERELDEYVITRELKKHFISFFNYYGDAFAEPTDDIGVWISGFFGSGKSHFLKMLSYILENKEVNGVKTVERFRKKFADDPATFMLIDRATRAPTETILFNIDVEAFSNKDKTIVLRVFAKMFYNHLGYFGENLKVAMLERYIDQCGKAEEFRRVFEEKRGLPWLEQRRAFAFNGKAIIPTLMEVLDMSEEDAKAWFHDKTSTDLSIAQLVEDMKAYLASKPKNYRLVFMIDEVGQYVGTDTDMLLNLQSLVEKIGSECGSKVWVVCTGQEAIDEIIKVRSDEFSRIQARFKTRLSLSSSSVDEVIQKRILKKTPEAEKQLEGVYNDKEAVLRNLFSFQKDSAVMDITGFRSAGDFSANYPFIPYQFIIMQKVFAEIRKHGNSGKHLSGGERSMLSGFQEAAQKLQERDASALAPFYLFYDTVHSFLDSSIRNVIQRCDDAARDGLGVEPQDVDVLKLLYLIRYIDNDIKSNLDNIVILMADSIDMDKVAKREAVRASLDRLLSQNYIGRTGETYNFLTDEEQDIQREIKSTNVDTTAIVDRIAQMVFGDIYATKKYRYGKYDFDFDKMVDHVSSGAQTGGMKLRLLTDATDATEKNDMTLRATSYRQAIVVLDTTPYFQSLESALKIRKYVKQRNLSQLPKSVQDIIRDQQEQATVYELSAMEDLKRAIEGAQFYADGELLEIKGGDAKAKLDQALEYLVSHVYSDLTLVRKNYDSDAEILAILQNTTPTLAGAEPNYDAAVKVEEYLEMQQMKNLPTSMADIQRRYQAIPYGWKEIDIAAVVALLIAQQKVTIKYAGNTVQPNDTHLPDMLRKKSEIGKVSISKRVELSGVKVKQARDILRLYFDVMDVPEDEDGLIQFIIDKFNEHKAHLEGLSARYANRKYPDQAVVTAAIDLTKDILSQQKDNTALIDRIIAQKIALSDSKEDMNRVEDFFKHQVTVFDAAARFEANLRNDLEYIKVDKETNDALNQIRLIVDINAKDAAYVYRRIPELNALMATVKAGHDRMLAEKRENLLEIVRQCMESIHTAADHSTEGKDISDKADEFFTKQKDRIAHTDSLALLDGFVPPMWQYKDAAVDRIERLAQPPVTQPPAAAPGQEKQPVKRVVKSLYRQSVFPAKLLENEEDIDAYLDKIREQLKTFIKDCDGIKLN